MSEERSGAEAPTGPMGRGETPLGAHAPTQDHPRFGNEAQGAPRSLTQRFSRVYTVSVQFVGLIAARVMRERCDYAVGVGWGGSVEYANIFNVS